MRRAWLKFSLVTRLLSTGFLSMANLTSRAAAPQFKLQPPSVYFADPKSRALLDAALAGDLARAHKAVADGADPNDEGPKDNPYNRLRLLHFAIAADNRLAVRTLMMVGADAQLDTLGGSGPALLFSITLDKPELLAEMLSVKPVATLTPHALDTVLFESITRDRPRCLAVLLKAGAPIDHQDEAGYTLLMRALTAEDFDLAQWLIEQGASVTAHGRDNTAAYLIQFLLQKSTPGTPRYGILMHLKEMAAAGGAVFPARSPKELREERKKVG
jgi:hypothetical protein